MTENSRQMMVDLLKEKGPELIKKIQMSEMFLLSLVSRQVVMTHEKVDLDVSM